MLLIHITLLSVGKRFDQSARGMSLNVTFIGGGAMAEALISGILDAALDVHLIVSEPITARRDQLERRYKIELFADNIAAANEADLVVLAVKPQQLDDVANDFNGIDTKQRVAVSIMAGVQMQTIRKKLGFDYIIRVMPNTPSQIGFGASAWTASNGVDSSARDFTRKMLRGVGEEVYFENEKMVDIATALSASGPAYVFVFIESLVDGAVQLGMSSDAARKLAIQMVLGSAMLAKDTGIHPAELRNKVTSPGGTTAAALHALEEDGFRSACINAILSAYQRGEYLAKMSEE